MYTISRIPSKNTRSLTHARTHTHTDFPRNGWTANRLVIDWMVMLFWLVGNSALLRPQRLQQRHTTTTTTTKEEQRQDIETKSTQFSWDGPAHCCINFLLQHQNEIVRIEGINQIKRAEEKLQCTNTNTKRPNSVFRKEKDTKLKRSNSEQS